MPSELYVDNVNFNSINNSQISGFRNLIINGRFTINQRGAASKIASSDAYNYDRWYYKSDGKLYQGIENLNLNASDFLTISWSSSTATAEYLFSNDSTANNGWDGSGTFTSVTNGGTFTVPSGLTTEHLWIRFTDATDTDFSELTKVQVEYGTKATMYEHRPIGVELSLCQRYFEKSYNVDVAPGTLTSEGAISYRTPNGDCLYSFRNKVEKRTTASYTIYNPATGSTGEARNMDISVDYSVSGVYASASGISIVMSGTSGGHIHFHYISIAEL